MSELNEAKKYTSYDELVKELSEAQKTKFINEYEACPSQALKNDLEVKKIYEALKRVSTAGRFIANSGLELKNYLSTLINKPNGITYNGKWYRYTGNPNYNPVEIYQGMIDADNRFRKGLYVSETKAGNLIEVNSYGGNSGKTLFEITDVNINNILDLTDENTLIQLGTSINQMKLTGVANSYEYTQEIAIWAKQNGYSGIKFYGAQGGSINYNNFVIFDQNTINTSINGTVNIIPW